MGVFQSLKSVTDVFDKIDKSEAYADIGLSKDEIKKGRSAFSTLVRMQYIMIASFAVAVAILVSVIINRPTVGQLKDKDSQITQLTRERDEFKYYVIPKLRMIEPKIDALEQKTDTLAHRAEQNNDHFSTILNKAKDASRN